MLSFLKKTINSRRLITGAILLLFTFFTACDLPMGLGDPVDTSPPTIFIDTPTNGQYYRNITQGSPIIMGGTWLDNIGVTDLRFEIKNASNQEKNFHINYSINSDDQTWKATIYSDEIGDDLTYKIKVIALDKFRNEGADQAEIRLDIVPPWVQDAYIQRHYKTTFQGYYSGLHPMFK